MHIVLAISVCGCPYRRGRFRLFRTSRETIYAPIKQRTQTDTLGSVQKGKGHDQHQIPLPGTWPASEKSIRARFTFPWRRVQRTLMKVSEQVRRQVGKSSGRSAVIGGALEERTQGRRATTYLARSLQFGWFLPDATLQTRSKPQGHKKSAYQNKHPKLQRCCDRTGPAFDRCAHNTSTRNGTYLLDVVIPIRPAFRVPVLCLSTINERGKCAGDERAEG